MLKTGNLTVYKKMSVILPVLVALLAFMIILAVALGAVYVPFGRSFRIILDNIGLIDDPTLPAEQVSIIYMVRLPRVIVACVAGAALSACGAVMQGLFRNPMADPGVLG
ncbi:MAG TPA: iron chelate uptake ABC transporter family permease subunit, partial [Clostridiales bacterium]|nr:iron chelate uptake ABC transporter family permease subunit [Clostridiales bacterium]